jgi:hypothetical protein
MTVIQEMSPYFPREIYLWSGGYSSPVSFHPCDIAKENTFVLSVCFTPLIRVEMRECGLRWWSMQGLFQQEALPSQ